MYITQQTDIMVDIIIMIVISTDIISFFKTNVNKF